MFCSLSQVRRGRSQLIKETQNFTFKKYLNDFNKKHPKHVFFPKALDKNKPKIPVYFKTILQIKAENIEEGIKTMKSFIQGAKP